MFHERRNRRGAASIIKNTWVLAARPNNEARMLDIEECRHPIPYELLADFRKWLSRQSENPELSVPARFLVNILDETTETLTGFGIETPTASDIRIVSGISALGCLSPSNRLEADLLDETARFVKNALFDASKEQSGESFEVAVYSLFAMFLNNVFSGFSDMSDIADMQGADEPTSESSPSLIPTKLHCRDSYRVPFMPPEKTRTTNEDEFDTVRELYRDSFFRLNSEVSTLSRALLAPFSDAKLDDLRPEVPGLHTLTLIAGRFPRSADAWFHPDFFVEELKEIYDETFPGASLANHVSRTSNWASPPSPENPRTKMFLEQFFFEELACSEMVEYATNMSHAISGRFDLVSFSGTKNAWLENVDIPSEITVFSPLQTPGFVEKLDEYAENLPFFRSFRTAFALDCLDVFAPTVDLKEIVPGETPRSPVLSENVEPWLSERLRDILDEVNSGRVDVSDVRLPAIPDVAAALFGGDTPLIVELANKKMNAGGLSFRDAVAFSILVGDSKVCDALGDFIGRFGESGAENVGRILADTVKTMSEADEPGRRLGETALEISVGRLFESLLDRPGIGRMIASSARKKILENRRDASPESSEGIRGILGF